MAAEVALVDLDLAEQGCGLFALLGDDLAQTVEEQRGCVLVHAGQRGRRPSRRTGHEMLHQASLNCPGKTDLPHRKTILVSCL